MYNKKKHQKTKKIMGCVIRGDTTYKMKTTTANNEKKNYNNKKIVK